MNNDVQVISKELRNTFPSNLGTYERIGPHTWKWALLFAYFAMVVDGIDIMLLSYSLTSLKAEFGLSTFQAGALGSASLAGMGIGGILGGWACDGTKSWQLTKIESLQGNRQPKERVVAEKPKSGSIYKQIFNNFKHRKMFLLWMTTAFFLQFGYYGINNWMPSYLETEVHMNFKNLTSYMVGSYTAMILGKILAGYLADKFNRRAVFVFGTIASAVFLPIIIFFNTPDNILYLLITFGFLYGIPYGVNATYMAESFSTDVRGTAIGGVYNIGRVGAAIAPATIGFLASGGTFTMAFIVMGAAYFVAGVLPGLFIKDRQYDPQRQS